MRDRFPRAPSARRGFRIALGLRWLVAALWIVSWLAVAPALLVLRRVVFPGLASLPAGPGELPAGDVALIILESARTATIPFLLAVLSGLVVLWAWTVLWHAGVVSWQLRAGDGRPRLGELLGQGMVAWWRYARLSAAALGALALVVAVLWIPLWFGLESAYDAMAERRLLVLLGLGVGATTLAAIVVWLATLHGAWLLGLPDRRSAVLAWLRGLSSALRMPLASLGTWLAWLVPALLVSGASLLVGGSFPDIRGGPLLIGVQLLSSLARSFCWVGLFCSFAPVTGVVDTEYPENADGKKAVQEIMDAREAWQEESGESDPPEK